MATTKKYVKVQYPGYFAVYPHKERNSLQMSFVNVVLDKYGRNGEQCIPIDELKQLRDEAEIRHNGQPWNGKYFQGALKTLCAPIYAAPTYNEARTKILSGTVNLEGLDVFAQTGLDPYNYGLFTWDQVQILDALPAGLYKSKYDKNSYTSRSE